MYLYICTGCLHAPLSKRAVAAKPMEGMGHPRVADPTDLTRPSRIPHSTRRRTPHRMTRHAYIGLPTRLAKCRSEGLPPGLPRPRPPGAGSDRAAVRAAGPVPTWLPAGPETPARQGAPRPEPAVPRETSAAFRSQAALGLRQARSESAVRCEKSAESRTQPVYRRQSARVKTRISPETSASSCSKAPAALPPAWSEPGLRRETSGETRFQAV